VGNVGNVPQAKGTRNSKDSENEPQLKGVRGEDICFGVRFPPAFPPLSPDQIQIMRQTTTITANKQTERSKKINLEKIKKQLRQRKAGKTLCVCVCQSE